MLFQEFNQKEGQGISSRLRILSAFFCACFLILFLRLWYVHAMKGDEFRNRSEDNRIRVVSVKPPRGLLFDRNGEPLADNFSSFNLALTVEDVKDVKVAARELERIMGIPAAETLSRIAESRRRKPFEPITLRENLAFEEVARAEAHQYELAGIAVAVEVTRNYPYGDTASHLLGYLGKITPAQTEDERYASFPSDTMVGQNGVERFLDDILRGEPGNRVIEVNARGREVRTLKTEDPGAGRDATLTLDMGLQQAAEKALGGRTGAVVAIDPATGDILAFVSKPSFDPNLFITGISADTWNKLNRDPEHPFNNRVLQSSYPPGSVFKIVTAIAGLETGAVTPDTVVNCQGALTLGGRSFGCWKRSGHGTVNMHRALVESCDVYFYELGKKIGIDTIAAYARALGLGRQTRIEMPTEKSGLIPDREWKQRAKKKPWYQGDTLSSAIGQGYVLTTPLQVAALMATVANNGKLVQPTLIRGIKNISSGSLDTFPAAYRGSAAISHDTMKIVRSALTGVVHEPGGTAGSARLPFTTIAGKTGTAQVVSLKKGLGGKRFQDHAWFGAFAPADAPRIAVAVMVEHGGHGGSAAAPVARAVIESFLRGAAPSREASSGSRAVISHSPGEIPPGSEPAPEHDSGQEDRQDTEGGDQGA